VEAKLKRNIIVVGHSHSGKTSLVESLLFKSGTTSRKGDVLSGTTVSDFYEDEIERKISINASFLRAVYNGHQIQIIDTPGYSDFIGETVSSLKATDAAVVVVDAFNGVEVGTEDVWERLESAKIPRIIFINKIEKEGVNPQNVLSMIQSQLSPQARIVDLNSSDFIERVAETDDKLIEKYLDSGSLSHDEVKTALRQAVLNSKIFPVFMGTALSDQGVKELLDGILAYFPSPVERPAIGVQDSASQESKTLIPAEEGPFNAFIFKSMFDSHLGQIFLARVFRGRLNANSDFININKGSKEHISAINMLNGKEQIAVTQATCGDIIALAKLKNTHVSDSITANGEKIVFEPITFPEPSISASIRPKSREDEEKISQSLNRLCEEDHTFRVNRDTETKELIVSGMGDLHLKVVLDRMKRRFHVDVDMGTPKVSYRETLTKKGKFRYKYKKQSGGRGQYGDVELEVASLPAGGPEYEFLNKVFGGAIPRNYIPSIEKGVKQAIAEGVLAGYPMTNIQVIVWDGSYHEVDSSDIAFQIAGMMAFKEAVKLAAPVLLEPIMDVSIVVPDEFIGQISGDINTRRGRIMGSEAKGRNQVIKAQIPLAEMFKYATDLRSLTGGRGNYSMTYSHYDQVPAKITGQIVAQRQAEKAAKQSEN